MKLWCVMLLTRWYVYFNPLEIPSEFFFFWTHIWRTSCWFPPRKYSRKFPKQGYWELRAQCNSDWPVFLKIFYILGKRLCQMLIKGRGIIIPFFRRKWAFSAPIGQIFSAIWCFLFWKIHWSNLLNEWTSYVTKTQQPSQCIIIYA